MFKIAMRLGAIGVMLCTPVGAGFARGGGGGHPGGGHPGGGGGHPGGGIPHFAAHFGGGHPGGGGPHFHAGPSATFAHGHGGGPHGFGQHGFGAHTFGARGPGAHFAAPEVHHFNTTAGHFGPGVHGHFAAGPRAFAARRRFATDAAFRPFLNGRHPYHHLGWIGPLFWPYAYGDFFYYTLWPDEYAIVDPFWVYGYGDIYEGIFSPYSYEEYVQGPHAQARMLALSQRMAQSCAAEAAEVTGWPIDQIHDAVQPDAQQSAQLDDLGNAIVKASDVIKSHCPTTVSFTPIGRLAEMQQRFEALIEAVNIVEPPLTKFYDALSDEQKARFDAMGAPQQGHGAPKTQAASATNPQAQCNRSVMSWPGDQIDRLVKPTDTQRAKLEALQAAATQAADTIKAACPSEIPSTPPARLEAVGKRLQAMLQAVQTIQPALADFYNALSDDQKARFNTMGRQLFAANRE